MTSKNGTPLVPPRPSERQPLLIQRRNMKMARSAHAYVRGSTAKFYEWLESTSGKAVPQGPAIWICGDSHMGNLGPLASANGKIDLQIRDLDQTVIGNPAHDLIRLGLSLASASRGSDLPGVTTAKILERMMEGYSRAFAAADDKATIDAPESITEALKDSTKRTWKHLAKERIEDTTPTIPLGKRFWPLAKNEKKEIRQIFEKDHVRQLITSLRDRDDDAPIELLDAAYWVKGCSSLGNLRYAALLHVGDGSYKKDGLCIIDLKEAVQAATPRAPKARLPADQAERVVQGALHLAPHLGSRMLAERFLDRSVFMRELLPQDMQYEIDQLTQEEAVKVAGYLAMVIGKAHARQMNTATRKKWHDELQRHRSKTLDAPSWLWTSIVELIAIHEMAYLEHCRKYANAAV